jgi:hypothetical protein
MRSQALVLFLISLFFVKFAQSQSNELLIQGQTGKLYLEHTVVAKENWYSIGRLYNISPKEIAPFNKLTMAQPLNIGQQLEIPLTTANFSQNGLKAPSETLVPLYHIIQEKEWMYRISVNHNKVPIGNLEKWNNINKDQVRAGMHLIVGFLKVKTALSALATNGEQGASAGTMAAPSADTATTIVPSASTSRATAHPASKPPAITATVAPPQPAAKETATTVKETMATVKGQAQIATPAATPAAVKEEPKPAKDEPRLVRTSPAATSKTAAPATTGTPATTTPATTATPAIHFNGGYFRNDFTDGGKSANGPAGIFKSTSGWQDGKYYALMNNVPVGTIVKINVPSTGKSIYAKILGQLPDMKESAGLTVRISNAAASELGEAEGKFTVEMRY